MFLKGMRVKALLQSGTIVRSHDNKDDYVSRDMSSKGRLPLVQYVNDNNDGNYIRSQTASSTQHKCRLRCNFFRMTQTINYI